MNYNSQPQQPIAPYYLTEEYQEKQSIKNSSNALGIGIILSLASSFFIILILLLLARLFGGSTNYNTDFNGVEPTIYYVVISITSIISLVVPFWLSSLIMKRKISTLIQFNSFDKKFGVACIGIGMATCICANFFASSLISNLNSIGIDPYVPNIPYDNNIASIILYIVSISIVPALVEEFAFRGVILGSLRKYGDGFAIIVSAALFGLFHANFLQIPFAFVIGLILGFLTVRLNSILPAMIIHFTNNFSVSISDIIEHNSSDFYSKLHGIIMSLVFILVGTLCLIYILKKDKSFFSISRYTSVLTLKEKFKVFASSAAMVVSLVLIALETLISSVS